MTREIIISPSMMCANFSNLKKEVLALDAAGVDIYHMDIMDGNYVPNFGLGPQSIETIRELSEAMIDVHLMIENPSNYIDYFSDIGVDLIYFHPDSDKHPIRTIDKIRSRGVKVGIAINPNESSVIYSELYPLVDYILVMTVNPGFSGQKFIETTHNKIMDLVSGKEKYDYKIVLDGAISSDKVEHYSNLGIDGFVLGTSALFGKNESYENIVASLR